MGLTFARGNLLCGRGVVGGVDCRALIGHAVMDLIDVLHDRVIVLPRHNLVVILPLQM